MVVIVVGLKSRSVKGIKIELARVGRELGVLSDAAVDCCPAKFGESLPQPAPALVQRKNGALEPVHLAETANLPDWTPNNRQSDQNVTVSKVMWISPSPAPSTCRVLPAIKQENIRLA